MTLEVSISKITKPELKELSKINDELEIFYRIQDIEADLFTGIGVSDSYIIDVYRLTSFDQENIGSPILTIDKLPVVSEKIHASPGDIISASVINGKGTLGHIDLELENFDISNLNLTQFILDDFGAESVCSITTYTSNGKTEDYQIQSNLYTNITPKVELCWVSVIDRDCKEKTLYDEYDEGWNASAVKAVLAGKEVI
jgi:hypothetical protein